MTELEILQKTLERERQARKEAERIAEIRAAELYASNQELLKLNKQLEDEVRMRTEESRMLSRLPEEIPDPVMRISRFGKISYVNSAYNEFWAPFLNKFEGDDFPKLFQEEMDQAILASAPHVAEFTIGERSWSVQFSAVEQFGYVNIMARDISEQKKAQQAIHKSQEALLEAQELGNLGRWEFNMQDTTFSWSPQLFRQYGFEPSEKEPAGGDFFLFIHPEDVLQAQTGINKAIAEGYAQFEQRIIRPDGCIRYLYTTIKAEHNNEGEPSRIYGTSLDVTELRHAEEQLRESEERFQLALQGMNDGLWDWNLADKTLYLSPQWKLLLGYADEELTNSIETFNNVAHPADFEEVKKIVYSAPIAPKHNLKLQMRMKHRDGSWRHFMVRCVLLRNKEDVLIRIVGGNTDITERINAEQKLLNSLEQTKILSRISFLFNSVSDDFEKPIQEALALLGKHSGASRVYVFENSSDGIFASNTFEWCQPGIPSIIESLQNVPYSALQTFHKNLRKQGIIASCLEEISPAIRTLLNKQGVKSLMIMPIYVQDQLTGFVGFDDCSNPRQWESADVDLLRTFANLTGNLFERQQSEYRLQQSEEKYRSLVENLSEVIFQTNEKGKLSFLNQAWHEITGYEPEDSLGQPLTNYIYEEDIQDFLALQNLLIERKTDFCRHIVRIKSIEGGVRYVEFFARLIEGKWGQAEGFSGTLSDVTQQQEIQTKLIHAKEAAEKASQIKAQFLSVMSHEIRTPLNAMLGISHLLIRRQPRPDQEENLRLLKFSGENLLSLINDILDFNKIESGKITLEKGPFSLQKLCNGLQKALSLKNIERNVTLEVAINENIPSQLLGDATRLTQILNNLLDNALKFTHEGLVKLHVNVLEQEGDQILLEFIVSDTGIGIPKESINIIFDAFTQVHSNSGHQYGGTGLGLAIIKRLLDLMGSSIEVNSTPGKGSKFKFNLAFELEKGEPAPVLLESDFNQTQHTFQGTSLLLVEDNPLNMLVLVQFCELWGLHPDVAENGLQALDKIREKNYDLVLMDLHMPEMDGIEATRHIRHEMRLHDLPIIALTANALPGIRQKVMDAGMNDYLSKPFEPEDLFQKISGYLPHHKQAAPPVQQKPLDISPQRQLYSLHKLYQQSNNNKAFVSRMLDLFIKTCREQLAAMQKHLDKGEAAAVRDIAHRLKPSIDLFCIDCQSQAVKKLELMELQELQTPQGRKLADNLMQCLYEVVRQMQEDVMNKGVVAAEQ